MLEGNFGNGWVTKFNERLKSLYQFFPDIQLIDATRYLGMLRVKFKSNNPDIQSIVDDVTYKVERDSSRICESCGNYGRRHEEHLSEKMCFCWKCYALKVDELAQNNNLNNE